MQNWQAIPSKTSQNLDFLAHIFPVFETIIDVVAGVTEHDTE